MEDKYEWEDDDEPLYVYERVSDREPVGPFRCPNCGSMDTGQSTYVDWCNKCGDSQGY